MAKIPEKEPDDLRESLNLALAFGAVIIGMMILTAIVSQLGA